MEMTMPTTCNKKKSLLKSTGIALAACAGTLLTGAAAFATDMPEKWELKFGFIKLTDMVPLAVAYEKEFLKMKT
jgi:nitrate/nitrite transport system substrate-binding protein